MALAHGVSWAVSKADGAAYERILSFHPAGTSIEPDRGCSRSVRQPVGTRRSLRQAQRLQSS